MLEGGVDTTTETLLGAARRALGPDAVVLVDASGSTGNDSAALAVGERVHAKAVARVIWDPGRDRARLHVRVAPAKEWSDESLTFAPDDAPSERSRTVGYAVAAMVQRLETAPAPPHPPAPAPPAPAPVTTPTPLSPNPVSPTPKEAPTFALFANAVGAIAGAPMIGGAVGAQYWYVRASAGGRVGHLDDSNASATTLFLTLGPRLERTLTPSVFAAARLDAVLFHHAVERAGFTRTRWLGGVDLVAELGWTFYSSLAVVGGLGAELAFGETRVNVGGVQRDAIPVVRGVAELGLRARF